METKHTKGEWKYNVSKKDAIQVIMPNGNTLHLGYIYEDDCGLPTCCRVEEHANAKLISAAPDLLEALIDLKSKINLDLIPESTASLIINAINKATK